MNNTDFGSSIESQVEAAWERSDRQCESWELPVDLAVLLLPGIASELTAEEVGSLLTLNRCNTLVELIERIGGSVSD